MRLVAALLSLVALAFAASAAADAPEEFAILDVFPDVNPCTGEAMTVTFVGTGFIHVHGDRGLVRRQRPNRQVQTGGHRDQYRLRRALQGAGSVRPRRVDRDGEN